MNKTLLACALALAGIGQAAAANIVIINQDPAGSGLNDPTAVAQIGGNSGTTVGEQRLNVYRFAAGIWGAILQSNVQVRVQAGFQPLTCGPTGAVLAQAGTITVNRDFPNAPFAGTWYHAAIADSLANADLGTPGANDINTRFNSSYGTVAGCGDGSGWYYGFDGNTPGNRVNFLDVALHEIGHGLGFSGFDNLATGVQFNGFPNTYSRNVFDNASGLAWTAMTDGQRITAATADSLVWTGATVIDQVPDALAPRVDLFLTGDLTSQVPMVAAVYGPPATPANFNGDVVLANDGTATPTLACSPLVGTYTGKVVLIDRGTCSFKIKTLNAQAAGATEVIVANNVASGFPGMGDDPATPGAVTIPSIGITQAAGTAIKAVLPDGVNAALQTVAGQFAGADATGRARLYAPATLAQGSTFSHFDVSHSPNAIMEPAISADLEGNARLDLTPATFKDVGWVINTGNASFSNCTTTIPIVVDGGASKGATLVATHKLCSFEAGGVVRPAYRKCMVAALDRLAAAGTITNGQATTFKACATNPAP